MYSLKTIMILVVSATLLYGCSGDSEKEAKTGKIDAMTKEIGQEAVRTIKAPINKAQAMADKAEERARETDERKNQ